MNNEGRQKKTFFRKDVGKQLDHARTNLSTIMLEKQKDAVPRMGRALEKIRERKRQAGIWSQLGDDDSDMLPIVLGRHCHHRFFILGA